MIARHRGDLRAHSRWRPSTPAPPPPAPTEANEEDLLSTEPDELLGARLDLDRRRIGQRKPRALIVIATVTAIAVIAGQQHSTSGPSASRLPSTPQQWVTQWTAAALQSPGAVCNRLYSPALARAFKGDTGHSCSGYYASITSTSFRVRHVLQDGPAAAVEAQELGAGRQSGYFTMLLSHVSGGWQAVDVVPGGSVRARYTSPAVVRVWAYLPVSGQTFLGDPLARSLSPIARRLQQRVRTVDGSGERTGS